MDIDEQPLPQGNVLDEQPITAKGDAFAKMMDEFPPEDEDVVFTGPLSEGLVHKNWKTRKASFEKLAKEYADSPSTVENFTDNFKKMVNDSNANAMEAALDALTVYFDKVENASVAASSVVPSVVDKCLAHNKTGISKKGQDLLLLIMEIDSPDYVLSELQRGFKARLPKGRLASLACAVEAVKNFGPKVSFKELLKKESLLALFNDQDGKVRKEAHNLVVLVYRYIKDQVKGLTFFKELRDAQTTELEKSFESVGQEPIQPLKKLRSDQGAAMDVDGGDATASTESAALVIDEHDTATPTPVISKLPKNFHEVAGGTGKWNERKEMLEVLERLASKPKLQANEDYLEVVKLLKKVLNDSNAALVSKAAFILGLIAKGLRSGFAAYTRFCLPTLLEKLKDKKTVILEPVTRALDNLFEYNCLALGDFVDDISTACSSKVPNARHLALEWLEKCLGQADSKATFLKSWKPIIPFVAKMVDDSTGPVRDTTLKILASGQVVLGESAISAYTEKLDKKQADKLKSFALKTEYSFVAPSASSMGPPAAINKSGVCRTPRTNQVKRHHESPAQFSEDSVAPPPKRPASATGKGKALNFAQVKTDKPKREVEEDMEGGAIPMEELELRLAEIFPSDSLQSLKSSDPKQRLAAIQIVTTTLEELDESKVGQNAELIIRFLKVKPSWKEPNFQVLNKVFGIINNLATRSPSFSKRCVWLAMDGIVDKLSDFKQKNLCCSCLTDFAEAVGLHFVFQQLIKLSADCKVPKTVAETLDWMAGAIHDFGGKAIDLKALVTYIKQCFNKQNPAIKTAGIKTLVALKPHLGESLKSMLQDIKPQLLTTVSEALDRAPSAASEPTRQVRGGVQEMVSSKPKEREDVNGKLTPALLSNLGDLQDWKKRQEALNGLVNIIEGAHRNIVPNVGSKLYAPLLARLGDSNKNLAVQTLKVLGILAEALPSEGSSIKILLQHLGPAIFKCLADNKANVRQAAIATLGIISKEAGFEVLIPHIAHAFAMESPVARQDLSLFVGRTVAALPATMSPNHLLPLVKPMIMLLQDRNTDVRKQAERMVPHIVKNVGFDAVWKETRDLKPAVMKAVHPILEKYKNVAESPRLGQDKENFISAGRDDMAVDGAVPPKKAFGEQCMNAPKKVLGEQCINVTPNPMMVDELAKTPSPLYSKIPINPKTVPPPTQEFHPEPVLAQLQQPKQELAETCAAVSPAINLQLDEAYGPSKTRQAAHMTSLPPAVPQLPPPTPADSHHAVARTWQARMATELPQLLERIQVGNNAQCVDALKVLSESYLSNDRDGVSAQDVNHTLEVLLHRVSMVFDSDPIHIREAKFLLQTLQSLFGNTLWALQVGYDLMHHAVGLMLERLQDKNLRALNESAFLLKQFNSLCLKLLENTNKTTAFRVLLTRLQSSYKAWDSHRSDENYKYMELVVKCLLRMTQCVSTHVDKIDLKVLLNEVHVFLTLNPPTTFKGSADMPLRTVKTLLNEMVKVKGVAIKQYLDVDPQATIMNYINCCFLKNGLREPPASTSPVPVATTPMGVTLNDPVAVKSNTDGSAASEPAAIAAPSAVSVVLPRAPVSMPPPLASVSSAQQGGAAHEPVLSPTGVAAPEASAEDETNARLDQVFLRIRNKDTTQDGIKELHAIITASPELDLDPWLSRCSQPFQSYIKRQLQKIQQLQTGVPLAGAKSTGGLGSSTDLAAVRARMKQDQQKVGGYEALISPRPDIPLSARGDPPTSARSATEMAASFETIRQRMANMLSPSGASSQ